MKQELSRFLATGIAAVVTDFVVYQLFILVISVDIAKSIGFICGSILAYLVNKFWTFEQKHKSTLELFKFVLLYTCTFLLNVLVNRLSLDFVSFEHSVAFAFLAATGTSTILNFLGMKFFVFTQSKSNKGQLS